MLKLIDTPAVKKELDLLRLAVIEARKDVNLSQKQVADKLGICVNNYGRKERGVLFFTLSEIIYLNTYLEMYISLGNPGSLRSRIRLDKSKIIRAQTLLIEVLKESTEGE